MRREPVLRQAELLGVRAHPRERRLRRLLHHLAELAGDRQPALARVGGRLDEEDVAADGRVGEPGRDARVGRALAHLAAEAARPEPLAERASSTRTLSASPFAIRVAALRQRSAMRRSRLRTPASRVYSRIDRAQDAVGKAQLLLGQPVRLELLRDEVALRDAELLLLGVARELDHVHAVEQRPGDRVERVRGADEQHLREVERQVEVVVAEVPVLLGVEHLEHRARRVAAEVGAHLVDLVDQEHRVQRLGVADRADDRPGHRRRCRCGGGRGSRPRRARRRPRCARTCGRACARSSGRATSCRRRAARRSRGSGRRRRA